MGEYQPQMTAQSAVHLAAAVVDASRGEKVLQVFRENRVMMDFVCRGHGTAQTEMLDLLGLGETAKVVVMCLAGEPHARELLRQLGRRLRMRYPGQGIAFTIPVTGIGIRWHRLLTQDGAKEGLEMDSAAAAAGYEVITVVMEQGYTAEAMDAARKAGARGGTVISARGIAEDEVKKFFGIEIQAEKEIVFLVVERRQKQAVMAALMKAVGMNTRSHGIVLSLPVSDAIGLAD